MNSRSEFAVKISITDDVATLETLETAAGTVPRKRKKKKKPQFLRILSHRV